MALSNRAIAEALGVSHTIVNRAVKAGRIDPRKPFDPTRFDWKHNADATQRSRRLGAAVDEPVPEQAVRRPVPAPAARHVPEEDFAGTTGPTRLGGLTKFDLELRDMVVRLKLRQVALREKEGALVQATEVRASWAALVLNAKSRLLQLGDERSDALACSSDRVHCKQLIDDKVYEILNELARHKTQGWRSLNILHGISRAVPVAVMEIRVSESRRNHYTKLRACRSTTAVIRSSRECCARPTPQHAMAGSTSQPRIDREWHACYALWGGAATGPVIEGSRRSGTVPSRW